MASEANTNRWPELRHGQKLGSSSGGTMRRFSSLGGRRQVRSADKIAELNQCTSDNKRAYDVLLARSSSVRYCEYKLASNSSTIFSILTFFPPFMRM
eukprot:scaffold1978_cov381-Prasinococcus_capsulatus_cf.AAC.12